LYILDSPAVSLQKREQLSSGLHNLIQKLLSTISDPSVSQNIISTLLKLSKVKNFPMKLITNTFSDSNSLTSTELWIGKLSLVSAIIKEHKLKPDGTIDPETVLPLVVEGLKSSNLSIREIVFEVCRLLYKNLGENLFSYFNDIPANIVQVSVTFKFSLATY
jgi:hypothetical protein